MREHWQRGAAANAVPQRPLRLDANRTAVADTTGTGIGIG